MKCLNCGSIILKEGILSNVHRFETYAGMESTYDNIVIEDIAYEIKSYVCNDCGYIMLFKGK